MLNAITNIKCPKCGAKSVGLWDYDQIDGEEGFWCHDCYHSGKELIDLNIITQEELDKLEKSIREWR